MSITTKNQFFVQLPDGIHSDDLSPELLEWFDSEDNISLELEWRGGEAIWSRKLIYGNMVYIVEYYTVVSNLGDDCGIYIELYKMENI